MSKPALLLVFALGAGCQPARSPSSGSELRIVAVDADPEQRAGRLLLRWEGEYDDSRELFVIVDERGYAGVARVIGRSEADCDHCPGPLLEASLDSGPGPQSHGAVAFGPVGGPLPKARMKRLEAPALDATWHPVLRIDRDGDGRWDLEQVRRCGHFVRSGCADEVCDMACSATTSPGQSPDPKAMRCVSFVPDVEDCPQL